MNPLSPNRLVDNAPQLRHDRSEHRVRRLALQFVQQEQFYAACVPVDQLDRVLLADDLQMTNFLESCHLMGGRPIGWVQILFGTVAPGVRISEEKVCFSYAQGALVCGF